MIWLLLVVVLVIGLILVVFVIDKRQTKEPIRRRYPVFVWGRKMLVAMGPLMRQYLFMNDQEETPYNRITRNWIYQTSQGQRNTIGFGSQYDMNKVGSIVFLPATFTNKATHLGDEVGSTYRRIIGGRDDTMPVIMPHFVYISGMSYGALSARAVRSLNLGAKKAGIFHNIGEGGLADVHLQGGSTVFQIGTAKNGVRDIEGNLDDDKLREVASHKQLRMFEIKLSQGAKPGKGGILPGAKVTDEIARIRGIEPGQDAISPNRHLDIKTNDDLIAMIQRIRSVTGKPVGFKAVIADEAWLDDLFSNIYQRGSDAAPDFITVDGADGGTGAAPLPLIDDMGLPLRESLPMLVNKLIEHGLRDRVKVIASGKLITPADVAWALCMGTDFVVSARGFMFALGCIQALQCNRNTCPIGIAGYPVGYQYLEVP